MVKASGYSGTPLAKKLGIKEGFTIKLVHAPDHYWKLFSDVPDGIRVARTAKKDLDFIHLFITKSAELAKILKLRAQIKQAGMIWISWPKKSSKIPTDITEDAIRNIALANKLVDIKVCAIDETWSGLKLVIPLKDRKS